VTRRTVTRVLAAVLLVAFLAFSAQATLIGRLHFADTRLPVLLVAAAVSSVATTLLLLAARARGAPWRWLGVALAWGALAAAYLSFTGEAILANVYDAIGPALEPLGPTVLERVPATVIAPIVEEPAKAAGTLIALAGIRRAGARVTVALGAAVGALVGLWFGLAEASHHMGEVVSELGFVDLDGAFVVDWNVVWQLASVQLVFKLVLAGLSNHALFSALAGVAIVTLWLGHRHAAIGWFAAALLGHALHNSIGVVVGELAHGVVSSLDGLELPMLLTFWLAALSSFVVAEGWAAVLLVRRLRRRDRYEVPVGLGLGESR
jgi:hypothetical protein